MVEPLDHTTDPLDEAGREEARRLSLGTEDVRGKDERNPQAPVVEVQREVIRVIESTQNGVNSPGRRGIAPWKVAILSGAGMLLSSTAVWHLTEPDPAPQPAEVAEIPSTELTADPLETSQVDAGTSLPPQPKKTGKIPPKPSAQPSSTPSDDTGSIRGNMWGDAIGDSFGAGDLGLSGIGEKSRTSNPWGDTIGDPGIGIGTKVPQVPTNSSSTSPKKK